ncbi:Lrp/AsnC family transcriptional regulator [Acetobacter persici]|uniref:Lrp/AsnC family transcriptional regulator n=1 Tax=Acetobacter persici TaxID=1076596 RepID=UPI0020CD8525|nr:Lrp/AsnC family transcriptional regulator [Acetobacter persici]MCP9319847.1 Lrp/AsnC family transcriptional regulator [Acetobacter persici]
MAGQHKNKLNLDRLAKIWALAERGDAGEQAAARNRAEALVKQHGYTLADVPDLLLTEGYLDDEPQPSAGGFTFYDMSNPAHQRAYAKAEEKKRAAWRMANRAKMDEVLARYGSEEAVFAPTAEEQAYDAVIKPFHKKGKAGQCDTWDGEHFSPSVRVRAALATVKPWPDTIPAAIAEYDYWEKLYDDRNIADSNNQYDYLGQGADFRRWALGDLINKEIEARDLSDVIIRLRFQEASQGVYNDSAIILRDLERLRAAENSQRPDPASGDIPPDRGSPATHDGNIGDSGNRTALETQNVGNPHVIDSPDMGNNERPDAASPPPFILNTASKRRAEVERILSTPEGARMSLRQIAGMAGVSPSTVMKVRSCLQEQH